MRLPPARSFQDRAVKGLPQDKQSACLAADSLLQAANEKLINVILNGEDPGPAEAVRRARLAFVAHKLGFIPSEQQLRGEAIHQLVTNHSPKLTKAERRKRRDALRANSTLMQKAMIKYKTYELGIAKMKEMFDGAGDPGYDSPQFFVREGNRRKQRRVRGRLQPIGRGNPQRKRRDTRVAA